MNDEPRVAPLAAAESDPESDALLAMAGERADLNIFRTFVRNPRVFKRWVPFGHILLNGSLPVRDRELLVLRTAHRCGSPYEWAHHERIALDCGIDETEIARVREGPDHAEWSEFDAVLLQAVDELLDDHRIGDATWAALAERYDDRLLIEVPMLVGHYHMLAITLNSLGVQPEAQH
jgi:alkylhydroperoxidase family enzyme